MKLLKFWKKYIYAQLYNYMITDPRKWINDILYMKLLKFWKKCIYAQLYNYMITDPRKWINDILNDR